MPMHSTSRQLWREVQVFDGLVQLDEAMNVLVAGGRIAGLWPAREFDEALAQDAVEAGRGGVMTPGLVDCHTHLVYAGNRAGEFEQRLEGVSYAEIAKAGGGILSSVRATRAASEDELIAASLPRLDALLTDGVTTVEIKSGYGLTLVDELKMLRVARRLGQLRPVRVVTTLLGAHALPPEYAGRADDYINLVCEQMIPTAAAEGLADAVDVFCEGIAFSLRSAGGCSRRPAPMVWHSRLMPSNSPIWVAVPWLRATVRCRPTMSNTSTRLAYAPWPRPVPSPCYCLVPSRYCVKPNCPLSTCCASMACPWPWPAMQTPELRRSACPR